MGISTDVYISIVGSSISTLVHFFGMLLLWRSRKSMDSIQTLILANLSVTELLYCAPIVCLRIAEEFLKVHEKKLEINYVYEAFITRFTYMAFILVMLFLTAERLLRLSLNLQYPVYWSLRRTQVAFVVIWVVSLIFGGLFTGVKSLTETSRIRLLIYIVLQAIFIVLSFCTYGFAISLIIRSRMRYQNNTESVLRSKQVFKGFSVGALVILTFLLFVVVPLFWNAYYVFIDTEHVISDIEYYCLVALESLATITDPVIYIFLSPKIRQQLACKKKQRRANITSTQMMGKSVSN